MNLCIDFGNTRVKAAIFAKQEVLDHFSSDYGDALSHLDRLVQKHRPVRGNYSSVKTLPPAMIAWLADHGLSEMTIQTPSPITVRYDTPSSLGVDRYCNAIAGWALSNPSAVLVIDAGSCITYDLVDKWGTYLGGAISPGYAMRLKAMNAFTSRLPLLEPTGEIPTIGTSTAASMQLGAQRGTIEEVRGFTRYFQELEPDIKVILTGGDQSIFEGHLENAIFAGQNLVLAGLNEVLLYSATD